MEQWRALGDDLVRGVAFPAAVMLLASCGSLAPDDDLPAGAEPMAAMDAYANWWSATEACAGIDGDLTRVEWYVVPGARSFQTDVGEKVGLWIKSGDRRAIVIAGEFVSHEMVVRHEMLHDLLGREGHPDEYFAGRCQLTWETWDGGKTELAAVPAPHVH